MEKVHKSKVGYVVSDRNAKTVVVAVETPRRHPVYQKIIRHEKKYQAADLKGECQMGDLVRITETRPLSREKHWRVAEIITKGKIVEVQPKEIG